MKQFILSLFVFLLCQLLISSEPAHGSTYSQQDLVGFWDGTESGMLLHFYLAEEGKLMLARYQKTPTKFESGAPYFLIAEQDPFELKQNDFDSLNLVSQKKLVVEDEDGESFFRIDIDAIVLRPQVPGSIQDNVDVIEETFRQYYPFFDLRGVSWPDLMRALRSRSDTIASMDELFKLFVDQIIKPLGDNHVALAQDLSKESKTFFNFQLHPKFADRLTAEVEKHVPDASASDYFDEHIIPQAIGFIQKHYLENVQSAMSDTIMWGILKNRPSVAYMLIRSMEDLPEDELNDVLDRIAKQWRENKPSAIIVDVRFNQGGDDKVTMAFARRFADQRRLAYSVQKYFNAGDLSAPQEVFVEPLTERERMFPTDIPVVVLTSSVTASAAEIFVLDLSILPNVKRVGEPTMGIFSDQMARRLPNGWWVLLSHEVYTAADGHVYEKIGIPPHKEAPFPFSEFIETGIDPGIDAFEEPDAPS